LVYGVEAVLPLEITMDSLHVQTYDEAVQDWFWCDDIDLVDKGRRQSAIKNVWYWYALKRYHQRFMRSRELQVNDLVLW
jgi:hypothetical protein